MEFLATCAILDKFKIDGRYDQTGLHEVLRLR